MKKKTRCSTELFRFESIKNQTAFFAKKKLMSGKQGKVNGPGVSSGPGTTDDKKKTDHALLYGAIGGGAGLLIIIVIIVAMRYRKHVASITGTSGAVNPAAGVVAAGGGASRGSRSSR